MNKKLILNSLYITVLSIFITACQPNEKTEKTQEADMHSPKTENIKEAPKRVNQCYHHLTGTLGDMKITVDLKEEQVEGLEEVQMIGYYRYNKYGGPIALYGSLNKKGILELNENGTLGGQMHQITGKWTSTGFTGEWISGSSDNKRFPVVLRAADNEALQFNCHYMEDSIKGFPQLEASPQAHFSAQWFEVDSGNKTLDAFMKKEIHKGMASNQENNNADFLEGEKQAYFEEYLSEMKMALDDGMVDTSNIEDHFSMNYDLSLSMDVFYNSTDTLTLGYAYYTYAGGAHGIYGTQVASYDLKNYKKIELKDVLKDGYEEAVSEALANAVRIKFELGEDAPLSDVLFEEAIEPNDNFGVTDKGIFFVFGPYEIASYAVGEIELFVAFDRISDFVK